MTNFNSWQDVEDHISAGKTLQISNTWIITKNSIVCFGGCCGDNFIDIEDAMLAVRGYAEYDLSNVRAY